MNYDFCKHYLIKTQKEKLENKGLSGLINIGNKCFLNSIIQCLSNTLKLTDYILSDEYKQDLNDNKYKPFFLAYCTLIKNIWKNNQILKPHSFIEKLAEFHPKYFSIQQQDSHECLLYLFELLHKSLSYEIDVDIKGIVYTKDDLLMKNSLEMWKKNFENNYSPIIKFFYGIISNNIKCKHCDFSEYIFEPFNVLSIDCVSSQIEKCLETNFKHNEFIESWKCTKCKLKGCYKSTFLWNLPNHLIIHLKRFKNKNEKNDLFVKFPLENFNLTNFIDSNKNDQNNFIYDCYSICYHNGDLNGGHYYSSCKNLNNNWYIFNDSHVTLCNNYSIENQIINHNSYIIFYQRKFIK